MSIITDGMAQVHCELPWQANLMAFPEKLTQHFQGVLEHGRKVSIFRTFENVGTGSNLAVHSILRVLENRYVSSPHRSSALLSVSIFFFRWIQDGGKLPDTIFIQIDGGGENTAKITLAMCEFLVAKGLTKKIILSRLPVGNHRCPDVLRTNVSLHIHVRSPFNCFNIFQYVVRLAHNCVYDFFCSCLRAYSRRHRRDLRSHMEENSRKALFDSAGVQATCRRGPNSCGESGERISSIRSFCYPGLCQVLYADAW